MNPHNKLLETDQYARFAVVLAAQRGRSAAWVAKQDKMSLVLKVPRSQVADE